MNPILDAIQESPKRYDDLTSLMGRVQLDIHLDKLRKQGKIKLNEHGKWEKVKPHPPDEPLPVRNLTPRPTIRLRKPRKPDIDGKRECQRCGIPKELSKFPTNGTGYREYRCYTCVAVRHRQLRALKRNQA